MSIHLRQSGSATHRWWRTAGIVALGLSLSACGHNMSGLQRWVAKEKAQPAGHIPPIPQATPYQSFIYPGHTKNPFNSSVLVQLFNRSHSTARVEIDPNRPRQYLEQFPLDSLKMVGTLTDKGITYGLIQTPDGTIQRVTIGNYMGQHSGKIIAIDPSRIKLREIVSNGFGGYKNQNASIAMSKEQ